MTDNNFDPRPSGPSVRAIREHYGRVARQPTESFFFNTGPYHAARLGYDHHVLAKLPAEAVESFCGVTNPFALRRPARGERVLDIGCGAGLDAFIAAHHVGSSGRVVGIDVTEEMVAKASQSAGAIRSIVEFEVARAEDIPIESGWADTVLTNGVLMMCHSQQAVLAEARRCLKAGGWLHLAEVVVPGNVPVSDTQGFLTVENWADLLESAGFSELSVGSLVDCFEGAPAPRGAFRVLGCCFVSRKVEESPIS